MVVKKKKKPEVKKEVQPLKPITPSETSRDVALEFEQRGLGQVSRRGEKERLQQDPEVIALQEQERRQGFQQVTGSGELIEKLEEQIAEPPSLQPELQVTTEGVAETGIQLAPVPIKQLQNAFAFATGGKKLTNKQIAETKLGKALGLTVLGTDAALAAYFTIPAVTQFVASSTIAKTVLGAGGSVPGLTTAIAGVGLFLGFERVFDFGGGEMDVLRQGIKKVVEDGERIEASGRNGYLTSDSIPLLMTMAEGVASAEARIKELGNFNVEYRVDKEFILDQQNARSAREAILRRVLAVENTAATGQASLRPEELLFNLAQFEK